ncbi:MAG: carboxypeptidase regulatory-like domain-containing protein, partial [Thermoproteus sp.]|nr:carboxypeptidase regulatory-like domain-containing protein [Thermoproteus sp.]
MEMFGMVSWVLPPYGYPLPQSLGAPLAYLPKYNASGYLPLPTLNAFLANSSGVYGFKYLNWSQAVRLSNFFSAYGLSVGTNSYTYNFRIYYNNSILVGTANVIASYPYVYSNGTIIETQDNVAGALRAYYGPYSQSPYTDAYTVQSKYYNATAGVYGLQGPYLAYRLQHAVHIAVNLKTINLLLKDFCGNVPSIVSGTISLTISYSGLNITLPQLPVSAEVPATAPVAVDDYGKPLSSTATAYVTLNYFGYTLYGTTNNTALPTGPMPIKIALMGAPYFKPVVYLPIAPQTFQVLAAVWTEEDDPQQVQEIYLGPQYPLAGFVVVPVSLKNGARMGEAISNASGYAFFDELPLGVPFNLIVRTLDPAVDMAWPYTAKQSLYGNSYADYASWLGFTPGTYVYTLGTRGPIDAGLVVNKTTITLTSWCGAPITAEAQVYNPVFRVFDKTGKYLLSSQFVTPGPYPGAAPSMLVNVTLVIADEFSPYNYSSRWKNLTNLDYIVLTDFRLVGMTGMRTIFNNLAAKYLDIAKSKAGCTTKPTGNASDVAAAFAYAAMAGWLANSSTDLYSAVFKLYSAQPKTGVSSICDLTPATVGTYDTAHLFLPGMRLRVKVWYMGYLVYDGYVTLDKPTVDIRTEVVPVNVTALTKDLRLPVDSYVGFTLANGYFGLALKGNYTYNFANVSVFKSLVSPYGFANGSLQQLLVSPTGYGSPTLYNSKVLYNFTEYAYYGKYAPAQSGADIVYLPNLAVLRNATIAKYLYTVNMTNGVEYMAGFDRWLLIKYPAALIRTYDQFERDLFYFLLTLGNTPNYTCPCLGPVPGAVLPVPRHGLNFTSPSSGVYTTSFWMYTYNSINATNLLNYRTLLLYLPWGVGTNATVTVKVVNVTNGATYTAEYSLSEYASLMQNLLPYEINLRNLALKVAPGDKPVEVQFVITVNYISGPTASYYAEPKAYLLKGVGLNATYANVTVGVANGKTVSYKIVNLTAAGFAWSIYGGFGMPVTYIVKAGQIALLPAWASNTAAAGSYISRIWIIAAGSKQALCTDAPAVRGPLVDDKGANVVGYDFFKRKYLVVNYLPDSTPVTKPSVPIWTSTSLDEFLDGYGMIAGLGFPIGGTSAFAITGYINAPAWNVTALYLLNKTVLKLPTTALDWLTVYNNASFPILVSGVTMKCGGSSYTIPVSSAGYAYVPMYQQASIMLSDYGFGRSYAISAGYLWSPYVYAPNYTYAVTAYYGGIVDTLKQFQQSIAEQAKRALSDVTKAELKAALAKIDSLLGNYTALVKAFNLQPLSSVTVLENVLYASHAEKVPISGWNYTFNVLNYTGKKRPVTENTTGTWGALITNSSDYDFKYYFSFPELPLKYVLDWNARPLANQTVVLFDRSHNVYAVIYTTNTGRLAYDLPDISALGKSDVVYVSWFDGYPLSVLTGNPAYLIWVYQQDIQNDVYQLGNATTTVQIRTYVYPATLTVYGPNGQPLAGVEVQVYDQATEGAMFYFMGATSSSGAVTVWDKLISSYPTGPLSQLPATNFAYEVLYPYSSGSAAAPADAQIWVPVATGTFSIQRGATVPSSGYSIVSTVGFLTQLPMAQPVGVSGYFTMSTPQGDIVIPFKTATAAGTSYLVTTQPIPTSVSYPLTMTVEAVYVDGVPIKLAEPFTAGFTTTALPASLDLASLGLLAPVTVQAVDGFGKLRTDWPVTISIGSQTIASGGGQVTAYLPLSQYAGNYTVTVATTVKTPTGAVVTNVTTFAVAGPATYVVEVPSAVISASVVDAFGTALTSAPVQIANVASGTGSISAEVLAGAYTVAAQAYGYTWSKSVSVSPGQTANVQIVVP